MVYGAAAWAYAGCAFTGQRAIPENVDLHEEFAQNWLCVRG